LTWTSDAEGLNVTATGQYFHCYDKTGIGWVMEPVGGSFEINGYNVIDKTKMMYGNGYCMVATFIFDTEAVISPGDYTVNLLFEMGFA
jgi:hypothetical protein